jgi:hypothetical protein
LYLAFENQEAGAAVAGCEPVEEGVVGTVLSVAFWALMISVILSNADR